MCSRFQRWVLRTYFSPSALRNFILRFISLILIFLCLFTFLFFWCVLLYFGSDITFHVVITPEILCGRSGAWGREMLCAIKSFSHFCIKICFSQSCFLSIFPAILTIPSHPVHELLYCVRGVLVRSQVLSQRGSQK